MLARHKLRIRQQPTTQTSAGRGSSGMVDEVITKHVVGLRRTILLVVHSPISTTENIVSYDHVVTQERDETGGIRAVRRTLRRDGQITVRKSEVIAVWHEVDNPKIVSTSRRSSDNTIHRNICCRRVPPHPQEAVIS